MVGAIAQHLAALGSASDECRRASLDAYQQALGEVHQGDNDIAQWLGHLEGPTVELMAAARRELAMAEYSAASGLYRQAFASLRLFLELNFAAVYFSVNELLRRQWMSDRFDFSWSAALDPNEGVLSGPFVTEFAPDLLTEAAFYGQSASDCYRYCSQLIHGKHRDSKQLPQTITYSADVLSDWCSYAKDAIETVLFLFYMRYADDIDAASQQDLHTIALSRFGHIRSIRERLGGATD